MGQLKTSNDFYVCVLVGTMQKIKIELLHADITFSVSHFHTYLCMDALVWFCCVCNKQYLLIYHITQIQLYHLFYVAANGQKSSFVLWDLICLSRVSTQMKTVYETILKLALIVMHYLEVTFLLKVINLFFTCHLGMLLCVEWMLSWSHFLEGIIGLESEIYAPSSLSNQ